MKTRERKKARDTERAEGGKEKTIIKDEKLQKRRKMKAYQLTNRYIEIYEELILLTVSHFGGVLFENCSPRQTNHNPPENSLLASFINIKEGENMAFYYSL